MLKLEIEKYDYDGKVLMPIPVEILVQNIELVDFEFYLSKNDNDFFKIRPGVEIIEEMLIRYQSNNIKHIFLTEETYRVFLTNIKQRLSNKFFDPSTKKNEENQVLTLNEAYSLIGHSLKTFGFNEKSLDFVQNVNNQTLALMRKTENIFSLFKKYKRNCNEGFLCSIVTSFTASCIVKNYIWNNDKILAKLSMAALLSDILLSKEDYELLKIWEDDFEKLPIKLKQYPIETAKLLSGENNELHQDIIDCVEMQRELPNGMGHPRKLTYQRIGQLPAILIISKYFAMELIKANFDFRKKENIKKKLLEIFGVPSFKKHLKTLLEIIDS